MDIDRRDFFRLGGGVAAYAVVAGLGLRPRRAYAVAGIDDVTLGGLVLLIATLGGYAVSKSVANVSLQALGYGFSDFVSDSANQAAAVTQTLADANNLSVELSRSNAEQAAASIAAGTGYFAEVMSDAATTGRVALDNFISGASELPGVLRNLVGSFVSTELGTSLQGSRLLPGCVGADGVVTNAGGVFSYDDISTSGLAFTNSLQNMGTNSDVDLSGATWAIDSVRRRVSDNNVAAHYFLYGNQLPKLTWANSGRTLNITSSDGTTTFNRLDVTTGQVITSIGSSVGSSSTAYYTEYVFSGSLVSGSALPVVDRAVDAPDVIGPGYDSLPLGNDLVIDPSTNDVVSAGSLPLPTGIPDVFGDFVGTLNDALAGVVPGVIGLPVSVSEPVVVGTAEGVASMPISDAIATETSLAASLEPPTPTPPPGTVDPPVTVPDGPWTPAIALPFQQLWPFNMIYSMVEVFAALGGE